MDTKTDDCISYFLLKVKAINIANVDELNAIINEINALEYDTLRLNSDIAQSLLIAIAEIMPSKNDHLLSKYCHVINSFCAKVKVIPIGQCLSCLMHFLISSSETCGAWVCPDVFFAMSSILYKNNARLDEFYGCLVGENAILLKRLSENCDENLQLPVLKCLQSLIIRNQEEKHLSINQLINICLRIFLCLKTNIPSCDNILNGKIILTSLKCLQNIYVTKLLRLDKMGELLGILKPLLFCGFPGVETISATCLYPSLISLPQTLSSSASNKDYSQQFTRNKPRRSRSKRRTKKNAEKQQQQQKNCEKSTKTSDNDSDCNSTDFKPNSYSNFEPSCSWRNNQSSSDSDFSDLEGTNVLQKIKTSIRQHSYAVLHSLIKAAEKKVFFGFWSSFLPETVSGASVTFNKLNLFTTILKDPSSQVRMNAVGVIAEMMRGSKQFLSLVDDRAPSGGVTSFTSASSVLTSMVNELHRCLLLALVAEKSPLLLTQILKCYAMLIDNIPYKRLHKDLLYKLLLQLKPLLFHKDCQVQVACLTVIGSMLQSDQVPDDVSKFLVHCNNENDWDKLSLKSDGNVTSIAPDNGTLNCPWIINICKNNIFSYNSQSPLHVLVESLQLLAIFVGRHFNIVRNLTSLLEEIIITSLNSSHFSLQLHGAKLLEVFGRGITNDVNKVEINEKPITVDVVFELWTKILTGPLCLCISNEEQPTLRAVCCDCLSTIPSEVFDKFPRKTQLFWIMSLYSLSSDVDHTVRGAAVRCLGIYALFPSLREDLQYLSDIAQILCEGISDSVFIVRTKASWAMGNVTDALFLSRDEFPDFEEQVTIPFLCSIGVASVKAAKDDDRIQASAVRCLGNLLNFLPHHFLGDKNIQTFVVDAHGALLDALPTKLMKLSWNTCYALGNVFKNTALMSSGIIKLEPTLQELLNVLSCPNFKVRINAVLALSALQSRKLYGDLFTTIYIRLIDVLITAEVDANFKEMVHFENLCDSVCFSLCQLLHLSDVEDLQVLNQCVSKEADVLLMSMWKFGQNTSAEKIVAVDKAIFHIEELKESQSETGFLELLLDILNQAKTAYLGR